MERVDSAQSLMVDRTHLVLVSGASQYYKNVFSLTRSPMSLTNVGLVSCNASLALFSLCSRPLTIKAFSTNV